MIPKIIHTAWFGGEMPEEFRAYMQTWKNHHPEWDFICWSEAHLPGPTCHRQLFNEAQHPAYKAEIVRYEAVLQHGGIWVDTDFECFKPFDALLGSLHAFAAWGYDDHEKPGAIFPGLFGAEPGHPWVQDIVDGIPGAWKPDRMSLGPWYITPITKRHPEVFLFQRPLFYPYQSNEKHRKGEVFPDAYAAHHWAGSWVAHHQETLAREAAARSTVKKESECA